MHTGRLGAEGKQNARPKICAPQDMRAKILGVRECIAGASGPVFTNMLSFGGKVRYLYQLIALDMTDHLFRRHF